jgi:N-acetylgalactosamine kinase
VAEFTAKAEQYVGVTSGGMDQAISIMGRLGIAQLVEFNPVRGTDVPLPPTAAVVIANSMAVSNKAEGATGRYNLRVVECRLAAMVLAVLLGESKEAAQAVKTLKDTELLVDAKYLSPKPEGVSNLASAAVAELLHEAPYHTAEIEALLGCSLTSLYEGNASALRVLGAHDAWHLHPRASHVYSEQQRVKDFAATCNDASGKSDDQVLSELGALMDASQASCRDAFQCSCPELDALVAVAKGAGAMGARLTGAGWGGCTVSLVKKEDADGFIAALVEGYYKGLMEAGKVAEGALGHTVFASPPASGGAVLRLKL